MEILEIARENEILVVEDNPYGLLYFQQAPPHAMRSADEEGVVYLGTFSKTLAPGLRVGWALAPHAIREKLVLANEAAILSPSSFAQTVISEYLSTADWKGQIDTFRGVYRERRDAMLLALGEHLPGMRWTIPTGGFYVWLTMPDNLDSKAMLPRAVKELVAYTPGTAFYADGNGRNAMRLSFCYPTPEAIREGVRRLATVINGELALLDEFSQTGPVHPAIPPSTRASCPRPSAERHAEPALPHRRPGRRNLPRARRLAALRSPRRRRPERSRSHGRAPRPGRIPALGPARRSARRRLARPARGERRRRRAARPARVPRDPLRRIPFRCRPARLGQADREGDRRARGRRDASIDHAAP